VKQVIISFLPVMVNIELVFWFQVHSYHISAFLCYNLWALLGTIFLLSIVVFLYFVNAKLNSYINKM